ncbi:MAG TPA: hypothetical protein VE377_02885 [Candidatus Dormibacteraeota bacterium]|nr:hypothetical protein [Candidatus Dormibacteraeota bacterium]
MTWTYAKLFAAVMLLVNVTAAQTASTVKPVFVQHLVEGQTIVYVSAAPESTVKLYLLSQDSPGSVPSTCDTTKGSLFQLKGTTPTIAASANKDTGVAEMDLSSPLVGNTFVCASAEAKDSSGSAASDVQQVETTLDWGRVRAYFAGGVLIASGQNSFSSSSATEFVSFNIEKTWLLPGCSLLQPGQNGHAKCQSGSKAGTPGVSTYFETRLTAIPVSTTKSTSDTGTASTFQTSQKTARLGVGVYFPWVLTHWYFQQAPNALFIAPLAKVGFDTLTGPTSQAIPTSTSNLVFDRFYNHYGYGMRIGHYGLTSSPSQAPELISYLDVTLGHYSNLQSFVCEPASTVLQPFTPADSQCGAYFPPSQPFTDSRVTLNRLDLEGILKIPKTVAFVGFNANVKASARRHLDLGLQPSDDLRFLFGVKLDIASVMQKLGVSGK